MPKFLVCVCGWRSKAYPDDTVFCGLGGELSCPECTKKRRNRQIEVYGLVHVEDEHGYTQCVRCGEKYDMSKGGAHASPINNWCINCWLKVTPKKDKKKYKIDEKYAIVKCPVILDVTFGKKKKMTKIIIEGQKPVANKEGVWKQLLKIDLNVLKNLRTPHKFRHDLRIRIEENEER